MPGQRAFAAFYLLAVWAAFPTIPASKTKEGLAVD
jgi:hypothetical protein